MVQSPPDRYGVVGHPVAHSLSPQIHAAFAAQTGMAIDYARIEAPLDGFVATAAAFAAAGGRGINVTVPFKLDAFAWCGDRVTARARRAGAVNCIAFGADGPSGDNTDGAGLVADLRRLAREAGRSWPGGRLLLLGAGGAARGVLGPLAAVGFGAIVVANRDRAKAATMVRSCADDATPIDVRTYDALGDDAFDVIVNATSASLGGAVLPIPGAVLGRAGLVYDMMYGAVPTPFLVAAAKAGAASTSDGLGMLVEQAAESFVVWRDVRPDTGPVRDALRQMLEARR